MGIEFVVDRTETVSLGRVKIINLLAACIELSLAVVRRTHHGFADRHRKTQTGFVLRLLKGHASKTLIERLLKLIGLMESN